MGVAVPPTLTILEINTGVRMKKFGPSIYVAYIQLRHNFRALDPSLIHTTVCPCLLVVLNFVYASISYIYLPQFVFLIQYI